MLKTITEQRNELSGFSDKMTANEIIEWNDMVQNPEVDLHEIETFVSSIKKKYSKT